MIVTDVLDLLPTLGPIFLLILLGQWFFRRGFPDPGFWLQAERLTYFVLFPSLLIQRLASANLAPYRDYAAVILLTMTAASALLFPLARGLGVGPRGFAAVYQGAIRFNTYIALALASALYGPSGVALMALIIAIEMPLVNVLAVWVLSRGQGILGAGSLVKMLLSNPLIVAALIGLGLNLGGISLPASLGNTLDILARAALPLGLLTVGAGLQLAAIRRYAEITLAVVVKLAVLPLLVYGLARWLGMGELETAVLVVFHAVPAAPSAYILTRQLGGDAALMAAILTLQVAVAMASLPLVLVLLPVP